MRQLAFSTFDGYESKAAAKKARDEEYRRLTAKGTRCHRWVLRDQLRKYIGFGQPDGSVTDVYMLDIVERKEDERA